MAHEHFKSCIDARNDCALACDHCAASCLKEQDVARMARGSEFSADVCDLCASICDACAQECDGPLRNPRRMASAETRRQSAQRPSASAH